MFSLACGYFNTWSTRREVRLLLLGLSNAGKTTILEQLKSMYKRKNPLPFHKIQPTVGLNIVELQFRTIKAVVWDVGGSEKFRPVWEKYYQDINAVLFVVDSNDMECLPSAKRVLKEVVGHPDLCETPVLILANKQDLNSSLPLEVVEAMLDVDGALKDRPFHVQACSAYTRNGIEAAFFWLIKQMRRN
jgi:ADP-ribosylation factor related protein 1